MFEEVYQRHRDLDRQGRAGAGGGGLRFDEFSDAWRLSAKQITTLHGRARAAGALAAAQLAGGVPDAQAARRGSRGCCAPSAAGTAA